MRESQAAELLIKCAAYDQRTIGEADALAWSEVLEGIRLVDALEVVKRHYATCRDRVMPFDIRSGVKVLRERRLAEAPEPIPPHYLLDKPEEYGAWLRAARAEIADGKVQEQLRLLARDMPDLSRVFPEFPRWT